MDASEELALIRNIDFEVASTPATEKAERTQLSTANTESAKTQKNRKKKLQVWIHDLGSILTPQ